jgi:hypothetical protein
MKNVFGLVILFISITGYSQGIEIIEGNLEFLAGVQVLKTKFVYENILIGDEGIREADYVKEKEELYNGKEPDKGTRWKQVWYADRKNRYEPRFNEMLEKYGSLTTKGEAQYLLIFETTKIEPGFNVGLASASSRIDAFIYIVNVAYPSDALVQIALTDMQGRESVGSGYDTGYRIQEAFARSGVELGRLFKKAIKK